jgi:hypothetical protein
MKIDLVTKSTDKDVEFNVDGQTLAFGCADSTIIPSTCARTITPPSSIAYDLALDTQRALQSAGNVPALARVLVVQMNSNDQEVTLTVKPSVIAMQERQERLNKSIRLGFMPPARSTIR